MLMSKEFDKLKRDILALNPPSLDDDTIFNHFFFILDKILKNNFLTYSDS